MPDFVQVEIFVGRCHVAQITLDKKYGLNKDMTILSLPVYVLYYLVLVTIGCSSHKLSSLYAASSPMSVKSKVAGRATAPGPPVDPALLDPDEYPVSSSL